MPDVQRNNQSITTTSATTAPAAGTSETWTVTALAAGIATLTGGNTYALVDATAGATTGQQAEIVRVTAATAGATSITVTRGVDGTTPVAHANPSTFNIVATAAAIPTQRWPSYAALASNHNLRNDYDNIRGIYNWKSSNTRRLDQAIANAGLPTGGQSDWLVIGDSVTEGAVSSVGVTFYDRLRSWPIAMRDQLANCAIAANGTGMVRMVTSGAADPRWVYTGTWTNSTSFAQSNTVGATATLTPDRGGTVYDHWYYDSSGGTFTIAIDGATSGANFATVVCNGSAGWKSVRMYGVSLTANFSQIKITITAAGGTATSMTGGSVWSPNGGLIVHNVGQSGSSASGTGVTSWGDTGAQAPGAIYNNVAGRKRTVTDASSTAGSSTLTSATGAFTSADLGKSVDQLTLGASGPMFEPGSFIGAILSGTTVRMDKGTGITATPSLALTTGSAQTVTIGREPGCIHIALGLNDMIGLSATDATITTAITNIRNRFPDSDCILHLTNEVNPTIVSAARQATFQAAMYALADTLDVPLYDWRDRVGTFANGQANGVYGDRDVHLTPATTAQLGAHLAAVLGGGPGRTQTTGTPQSDNDVVNLAFVKGRRSLSTPANTATTTVESVILRLPVPANGFKVGDILRYSLILKPTLSSITTVRIRIGATGTITDAAVVTMSATAAINTNIRRCEGESGIQAIGASATHLGAGTEQVANISAAGVQATTSGTFNSTVRNYVTVTVQNSVSTTTVAHAGVLEWLGI